MPAIGVSVFDRRRIELIDDAALGFLLRHDEENGIGALRQRQAIRDAHQGRRIKHDQVIDLAGLLQDDRPLVGIQQLDRVGTAVDGAQIVDAGARVDADRVPPRRGCRREPP